MWLFENLKARILKSIITWSEMGQQTTQAKEVYSFTNCPPCVLAEMAKVANLVAGPPKCYIHRAAREYNVIVRIAQPIRLLETL